MEELVIVTVMAEGNVPVTLTPFWVKTTPTASAAVAPPGRPVSADGVHPTTDTSVDTVKSPAGTVTVTPPADTEPPAGPTA
jgi:hypothetical protein